MSFFYFLIIGIISGWLAGKLLNGGGFGLIKNLLIGVVGAFVGGWLFDLVGLSTNGSLIGSIITSTVGAVVLLFVLGMVKQRK